MRELRAQCFLPAATPLLGKALSDLLHCLFCQKPITHSLQSIINGLTVVAVNCFSVKVICLFFNSSSRAFIALRMLIIFLDNPYPTARESEATAQQLPFKN
jgi:hypothetical protein